MEARLTDSFNHQVPPMCNKWSATEQASRLGRTVKEPFVLDILSTSWTFISATIGACTIIFDVQRFALYYTRTRTSKSLSGPKPLFARQTCVALRTYSSFEAARYLCRQPVPRTAYQEVATSFWGDTLHTFYHFHLDRYYCSDNILTTQKSRKIA